MLFTVETVSILRNLLDLPHKRGEIAMAAGKDADELCRIYARAY